MLVILLRGAGSPPSTPGATPAQELTSEIFFEFSDFVT